MGRGLKVDWQESSEELKHRYTGCSFHMQFRITREVWQAVFKNMRKVD